MRPEPREVDARDQDRHPVEDGSVQKVGAGGGAGAVSKPWRRSLLLPLAQAIVAGILLAALVAGFVIMCYGLTWLFAGA
jgi:hypothetical protein